MQLKEKCFSFLKHQVALPQQIGPLYGFNLVLQFVGSSYIWTEVLWVSWLLPNSWWTDIFENLWRICMQRYTERLPQCKFIVLGSDTIASECILKILVSSFDLSCQDGQSFVIVPLGFPYCFSTPELTFYFPFLPWVWWHGVSDWKRKWEREFPSTSCHLSSLGNIWRNGWSICMLYDNI